MFAKESAAIEMHDLHRQGNEVKQISPDYITTTLLAYISRHCYIPHHLARAGRRRWRPEGAAGSGVLGPRSEPRPREARDRAAGTLCPAVG
jgi:hypothetical protein